MEIHGVFLIFLDIYMSALHLTMLMVRDDVDVKKAKWSTAQKSNPA